MLAISTHLFLDWFFFANSLRSTASSQHRLPSAGQRRTAVSAVPTARWRSQRGGSLIEALVALLVFSVGALGIAALQVTTVLRVDDSKQRTIAMFKAQELLERIRAAGSSSQAEDPLPHYVRAVNNTSLASLTTYSGRRSFQCGAVAPAQCLGADPQHCAVAELAQFDVWTTFCDPVTGIAAQTQKAAKTTGAVSLKGLDLALSPAKQGHNLYVRWVARDPEQNQRFTDGRTRTVDLCGEEIPLDVRLNLYCIRAL